MKELQQLLDESQELAEQALAAYREKRKLLEAFQRQHKHDRSSLLDDEDKAKAIARQWYTDSVVLFITRRSCTQCGHVSTMPSPELMVKSVNYQRNITEILAKPLGLIPPHVQREIIYHDLKPTIGCTNCFHGLADPRQMDLFNPRLVYPIHSEYPEGTPEVHYKLEDI